MEECDILIVGAGPAGCSAAFFSKLLNEKKDVVLCESKAQNQYGEYHLMCGEIVKNDLFCEIKPLKKKFIVEEIRRFEEHWPGGITISHREKGFMIDRPKYQGYITSEFEGIGGRYKELKVIDVSQKETSIKVKTEKNKFIKAKWLIAADGANSCIRNRLYKGPVKKDVLLQYIIDRKTERGVIHYFYDEEYEGNYKWIFPYGEKTKVGYPLNRSRRFEDSEQVCKKQARTVAFGGIENYVIGHTAFIGEAAAQTNALSKGGIRPGMIAGRWVAEAIEGGNIRDYDRRWKKSLFSSKLVNDVYEIQKKMSNQELEDHIKPFMNNKGGMSDVGKGSLNGGYMRMYEAYKITNEFGW